VSHRAYILMATIASSLACSCAVASALPGNAGRTSTAVRTPAAVHTSAAVRTSDAVHTSAASAARSKGAERSTDGRRHAKHARATCRRQRRHRRGHHRRCQGVTRAIRRGIARQHGRRPSRHKSSPGQAGEHTGTLPTRRTGLHARPARHGGEAGTVVSATPPAGAASTVASVLGTPCQNTEAIPDVGNLEPAQAATLCLVNQERARNGELPLAPNAQLAQAARRHSEDMVSGDYFAHVSPNGETPLQRVEASGYIPNAGAGYTLGENIAWGTLYLATPRSIVQAWIASPEHLANILDADYRDSAIAIVPAPPPSLASGQAGATYTQEFGVIER